MTKKLKCVLLIDDDKSANFLHKFVINKTGLVEKIVDVQSGEEGLEFLRQKEDSKYPKTDLIFLDINMPGMTGWDFLEEYNKLDESLKGKIMIIMLSTSDNPEDKEKASKIRTVHDFLNKPLTVERFTKIVEHFF
jgi:CheY-like chemotaxis protein